METISLNKVTLRVRKESFGFTVFDGNQSVQINETFYDVLRGIAREMSKEQIEESIRDSYDISDDQSIKEDIEYVFEFCEKRGWL